MRDERRIAGSMNPTRSWPTKGSRNAVTRIRLSESRMHRTVYQQKSRSHPLTLSFTSASKWLIGGWITIVATRQLLFYAAVPFDVQYDNTCPTFSYRNCRFKTRRIIYICWVLHAGAAVKIVPSRVRLSHYRFRQFKIERQSRHRRQGYVRAFSYISFASLFDQ